MCSAVELEPERFRETIDGKPVGQPSKNAFIGRYANRIAGARFTLVGTGHRFSANNGPNCVRGGTLDPRLRVFDMQQVSAKAVEMRYVFRDGEEGFPGTLPVVLRNTQGGEGTLTLEWPATAEGRSTVAGFAGHAAFNLRGDPRVDIAAHVLTIAAVKEPTSGRVLEVWSTEPLG